MVGSAGNDTIIGNAADNFLAGGPGNDTLVGNNGNDCVLGRAGNDTLIENNATVAAGVITQSRPTGARQRCRCLDGGPGVDTVDYGLRTNRTVVNLGVISWFNDGADPNADVDLARSATMCSSRRRTRSPAPATTSCRPTI